MFVVDSFIQIDQQVRRMMKAIRVAEFGGPEVLKVVRDIPLPKHTKNQVINIISPDELQIVVFKT